MGPPQPHDGLWIDYVELILIPGPLNDGTVVWGEEKVQKELPQLKVTFA